MTLSIDQLEEREHDMTRQLRIRSALVVSLVLLVGVVGLIAARKASAASFTAGEGSGPGWCASYGGSNQASYDGVYACSPNSSSAGSTPFDSYYPGFQCVELANRFLWDAYGKGPIFGSNLNGWNFAQTVHADYPSVPLVANGTAGQPYLPGDIVSFSDGGDGHVAVVTGSSENAAGNGSVTILQQNASPYAANLTVSNWALQRTGNETPNQFDAFTASSTAPATSPSAAPGGFSHYEAAFEDNTGGLWTVGTAGNSHWGLGEAATSPQIASLSNGGYEVAFEDNTGGLWTVGTAGTSHWGLGMMGNLSPSITGLSNGGYEVAFEDNTGNLWTVGSAGNSQWKLAEADTAPQITALSGGGYEVAFEDNTGNLWTVGSGGNTAWKLAMANLNPTITSAN